MTLKTRLFLMGCIGVLAALIVGCISLVGQQFAQKSVVSLLDSVVVTRNQMEADMMHDAIKGDVLSALLAAKSSDLAGVDAAMASAVEHGNHLREMFAENAKQESDPAVQAKIKQVSPVVDSYLSSADSLMKALKNAPKTTDPLYVAFQQQFKLLETQMGELSDEIEASSSTKSSAAMDSFSRDKFITIVVLIIVIVLSVAVFIYIIRHITAVLRSSITIARDIANGDLRNAITVNASDEMGQLLQALSDMQNRLASMIKQISDSAAEVIRAGLELAAQSSQVQRCSEIQNSSAESMAAAIEEMTASIAHVTQNAHQAQAISAQAFEQSRTGSEMIDQVLGKMNNVEGSVIESSGIIRGLWQQSDQIHSIVKVIKDIADQTNLLALNAAIEAARAGEQGRGFAVVADEVRNLAQRTSHSTQEIAGVVDKILDGTRSAIQSMDKGVTGVKDGNEQARTAGDVVRQTRAGSSEVIDVVVDIANAMREQKSASEELSSGVERIVSMSEDNVLAAQNAVNTASKLNELAARMKMLIAQFKLR